MNADDPILRAKAMLNRAVANGKPITAFLGFRMVHGQRRLIAVDDACDIVKSLPYERVTVSPSDDVDVLASCFQRTWEQLDARLTSLKATSVPRSGHLWRQGRGFAKKAMA